MSNFDPERFEAELRRLNPAKPPPYFLARLEAAVAPGRPAGAGRLERSSFWLGFLRWTLAATSAAALVVLLLRHEAAFPNKPPPALQASKPASTTDSVHIDHRLVADFDTVAQTPGGAPVRFRCREWVDRVVLRAADRGVVIERSQPRLEVVPVSFETY